MDRLEDKPGTDSLFVSTWSTPSGRSWLRRSSLTPQETSTGIRSVLATDPVQLKRLTDLYNEARYGEREVTEADIEALRTALGDGDS